MITRGCLVDRPSLNSLLALAAIGFDVSVDDLTGPDRTQPLVKYRHVVMAAAHWIGYSYPAIGRVFGRDHSTVVSSCRVVERDPRLKLKADILVDTLKNETGRLL